MKRRADFEWDTPKTASTKKSMGSLLPWHSSSSSIMTASLEDLEHGDDEKGCYCIGRVSSGIATARFTHREEMMMIIGAGYRRKGK